MDGSETIDSDFLKRTFGFHGIPLMKVWNEERGPNSLKNLEIHPDYVDTSVYVAREKIPNNVDRMKRLRIHKFICRRAEKIFHEDDIKYLQNSSSTASRSHFIPPLELFANIDKEERLKNFFSNNVKVGDIAYCKIQQVSRLGLIVKVLCTTGDGTRLLSDLNVQGILGSKSLILAKDSKNVPKPFAINEYICCEVIEINEQPQLVLGMLGNYERTDKGPPLGLITTQQLPLFYQIANSEHQPKNCDEILKNADLFKNPEIIDSFLTESGLDPRSVYSLMMSKNKFPNDEYAKDLRHVHASKLAFRSVAEGIEHFKSGRHIEAFQCLNKALTIDPQNVEGLVARGALYANSGSFSKAIVDFDAALKLNGNHANAKKYLGETLLALGRSYEDESKYEEAKKAYIDCLKVNPNHQEAQASLDYVKAKLGTKKIVEPSELELPPLNIGSIPMLKESKLSREFPETSKSKEESKKKKKDRKKKGKKRHSSSSDSSSESSESSNSSSESSDSDSSTDSDSNSRSKKKEKTKKEKSLSPFSKRMDYPEAGFPFNKTFDPVDDHEMKVRKFLEMGRDEDDYEDRVRNLMAETSKYQKSIQAEDAKGTKKKKKSEKKLKKDKKKRKKEDKKKSKGNDIDSIREALKVFENLPDFSKFQKLYQDKLKEEEAKKKKQDNDEAPQEKWKMKFSKDERKLDSKANAKPQFGFNYDSEDDEDAARNAQSKLQQPNTSQHDRRSPKKEKSVELPPAPVVVARPVVLDKFGNFRLADPGAGLAVKPPDSTTTRRSRSRSYRRHSRSRSDSRSPRRRRRSYSRSYSRSRSRDRSRERGRGSFRGRGDFSRNRRFSPKRGHPGRGRWNDFRDSRDFRGGRDRFKNDRFPRKFGGGGGGRFNRSYSRSPDRTSRSPDRNRPERSPDRRHDDSRRNDMSTKPESMAEEHAAK